VNEIGLQAVERQDDIALCVTRVRRFS